MKIAVCAGHGFNTPGKRSPVGEREWSFNNEVVKAFISEMQTYENVEILRTDDITGRTDVSLQARTDKANAWGADIYVSFHHNANTGIWGMWTGTETFTYNGVQPESDKLAALVQAGLVEAYGLRDRGLKKANFHILRETKMPAILTEGGYMDSLIDISKLRDNAVLANAGINTAKAVAVYGELAKKVVIKNNYHTVVSGETLWGISNKYGVTVAEIKIWNELKTDVIYVGQVLIVEKSKVTLSTPKPVETIIPKPTPIIKPVVKPIVKPKPKPTGIKVVGKIKIVNLNNFTYIYAKPTGFSKVVGKAYKNKVFNISGSLSGWFEVIHNGQRAYVKDNYAKRV